MARLSRSLLLASAALSVAVEHPALAQEPTPMYVVTYFEVAPSMSTEARALLKAFRDASRKAEGSVRVDALHRSERPNHFAIVEVRKSGAAQEAHARAPHTNSASSAPPTTSACTSRCPSAPTRRAPDGRSTS
jgi:quinol monooxygenase YgiN